MSKKKSVLLIIIALVLGIAIGAGVTFGVTKSNQTGTITADTDKGYTIETKDGVATVTVQNWSDIDDFMLNGASEFYLFPRSTSDYLKETYQVSIYNESTGPKVTSSKRIEEKDPTSKIHEYNTKSDIVSNVQVNEDNDTLTFEFDVADTDLTFKANVMKKTKRLPRSSE